MGINIFLANQVALSELEKGNEAKALRILRKNAKSYPSECTLNNLGVYYWQYVTGSGYFPFCKKSTGMGM